MKREIMLAVLMLLALAVVAMVAAPVFSGEHPWDSDFDGGDFGDADSPYRLDDTTVSTDTLYLDDTTSSSSGGTSLLIGILTGAASALI